MKYLLIFVLVLLASCSSSTLPKRDARVYTTSEDITVNGVIYTVKDVSWDSSLPDGDTTSLPKERFLKIRLSIRNQSSKEKSLPFLTLVDAAGNTYEETTEGQIPDWLGMLRTMAVGETIEGQIVFDVKSDAYKLQVSDGGEGDQETIALVELPARIPDVPMRGMDSNMDPRVTPK